jgi:small subunit ribosomal protein S20
MAIRSAVKTAFKKASAAIDGKKSTDAQELVKSAIIAVDTASSKGSIHKNTAARRKSRLMKKLNSLVTQAAS